jgi:hypothetical protein
MHKARGWDGAMGHARVVPTVPEIRSRQQQTTRRAFMGLFRLQVDAATVRIEFDWTVIMKPFFYDWKVRWTCRPASKSSIG